MVEEPSASAGDAGSVPGLGRLAGGGPGSPPQSSCLESPVDRGAWRAAVCGVAESDATGRARGADCQRSATPLRFYSSPSRPGRQRQQAGWRGRTAHPITLAGQQVPPLKASPRGGLLLASGLPRPPVPVVVGQVWACTSFWPHPGREAVGRMASNCST